MKVQDTNGVVVLFTAVVRKFSPAYTVHRVVGTELFFDAQSWLCLGKRSDRQGEPVLFVLAFKTDKKQINSLTTNHFKELKT